MLRIGAVEALRDPLYLRLELRPVAVGILVVAGLRHSPARIPGRTGWCSPSRWRRTAPARPDLGLATPPGCIGLTGPTTSGIPMEWIS